MQGKSCKKAFCMFKRNTSISKQFYMEKEIHIHLTLILTIASVLAWAKYFYLVIETKKRNLNTSSKCL